MRKQELMIQEIEQVGQVAQAQTDNQVLAMWLHGRPYFYEVQRLLAVVAKPLAHITLGNLQGYFSGLEYLAPTSRARAINAIRSLFRFAHTSNSTPRGNPLPLVAT